MFIQSTTIKNFNSHAKKINKYTAGKVLPQPVYTDTNVYYGCQNVMVRYVNAKPAEKEFSENVELVKYEDENRVKMFDHVFDEYLNREKRVVSIPVEKIKELQALLAPALILHHKSNDSKAAYETFLQIGKYSIRATCTNDTGSSFTGTVWLKDKPAYERENYLSIVLNAKYLTDLLTMLGKESHDEINLCIALYNENNYVNHCCITPLTIVAGQIESVITAIQVNKEFYEKSIAATN